MTSETQAQNPFFQLTGVGVVETDMATGRFRQVNRTFCEMVGYSEAELKAMSYLELTHPEDRERDAESFAVLQRTESSEGTSLTRVLHKDGSVVWLELHVTVLTEGDKVRNLTVVNDVTARRRTEDGLRESEERYRTLFDSVDEGLCTTEVLYDEDGRPVDHRIVQANPAFARQTGLADPEGKTASVLMPGVEGFWNELYAGVIRTGESERAELYSAAFKRHFDVLVSRVGDGTERRVAVMFTDVTERKRTETALRASEERLRLTVESISDHAIFTLDPERRVTGWNSGAEHIFGYSRAEAVGMSGDLIFTFEEQQAGVPEQEARTAQAEGRAADDRWHVRKDGTRFFASGIATPLRDGERVVGFVKVARDLTAPREAEEERERLLAQLKELNETLEQRVAERTKALKQSEQRFSEAFHSNPIPACMTTFGLERETFVEVNDALLALTGYERDEIVGKTSRELGMWSSSANRQELHRAQQDGEGYRNLELQLKTKDGDLKDVTMSAAVIHLDGGEGYLKMFYDITERKQTEEEMHRAVQAVMNDASWFSRSLLEQLARIRSGDQTPPSVELSKRERQVLGLVAGGLSNEAIAQELELRPQTVRNYVATIYDKLGVHTRAEAIVWARERGITGK